MKRPLYVGIIYMAESETRYNTGDLLGAFITIQNTAEELKMIDAETEEP